MASNPTLRDVHEYILIFSKGKFRRIPKNKEKIPKDEFLNNTKSIWNFFPESAKKVGHPAPFPIELPYRCIQLYTYTNDVVLDPFCGVGTTAIAALQLGRKFVCLDTEEKYVKIARKRVNDYISQRKLTSFNDKESKS